MLGGCTSAESRDGEIALSDKNSLVLNSEVDEESTSKIMQEALALDKNLAKGKPIYLILDTPGGSVDAGNSMITMLNGLGRPIHTITMFAASMGFQIAQGLGDRLILPNGLLMSHHARGGVSGEFGGSKGSQIDKRIGMALELINRLDNITVARTKGKKTLEQYQAEYENELWSFAEPSVKNGYADKIVLPRCDSHLVGTKEKEIGNFGLKTVLTMSKCPIIRGVLEAKTKIKTREGKWISTDDFDANGGVYGAYCPPAPTKAMCAADTSLTPMSIEASRKEAVKKQTLEWKKANITFIL